MLKASLAAAVLVALFVRDLRLLVSAGPARIVAACGAYCGVFTMYAVALALWLSLRQVPRPDLIRLTASVWVGILSVHLLFSGLTWLLSRSDRRGSAWLMALAPSPATYVCLCFLTEALPNRIADSLGVLSLLLFTLIWIALVTPLAYELARGISPDRFASAPALRVIGLLSLLSLLCVSTALIETLSCQRL